MAEIHYTTFTPFFSPTFSMSILYASDVDVPSPDEKSVITYVSSIYDAFPKIPEGGEGISAHVCSPHSSPNGRSHKKMFNFCCVHVIFLSFYLFLSLFSGR